MRLVEVITDAGLRGYSTAKAHVGSASNNHALVMPVTAEPLPLRPLDSYRAGYGRPARMPHWLSSPLLNHGNARESSLDILPADLATSVSQSMYVSVRVPDNELSDRIGKAGNRRCTGGSRRGLAAQIRRGQDACHRPCACGTGLWGVW
jgi:hypothetical protein